MSLTLKDNKFFDLILQNGNVVSGNNTEKLDIGIKDGKIADIKKEIFGESDRVIDASNRLIFPGFIDPHTHMGIPIKDTTSADDFESGSIAGAFGGVTTILDFTVQQKGQSIKDALNDRLKLAQGKSHVDFGIHINITDQPEKWLHQIPELIEEGFISFKVFSTYREAGMMVDWEQFRRILKKVNDHGGLLMLHAEDNDIIEIQTNYNLKARKLSAIFHARSRPPDAEAKAISNAAQIAGELDAVRGLNCTWKPALNICSLMRIVTLRIMDFIILPRHRFERRKITISCGKHYTMGLSTPSVQITVHLQSPKKIWELEVFIVHPTVCRE
jgi:dihydropyrimidinase